MAYGMADVVQRRRMIDEGNAAEEIKRIERGKLTALLAICETAGCRRKAILAHFGEAHAGGCGNCDTCRNPVETWDGTEAAIKALAAVYRTGERFGAGHVIDVLMGVENEKLPLLFTTTGSAPLSINVNCVPAFRPLTVPEMPKVWAWQVTATLETSRVTPVPVPLLTVQV